MLKSFTITIKWEDLTEKKQNEIVETAWLDHQIYPDELDYELGEIDIYSI